MARIRQRKQTMGTALTLYGRTFPLCYNWKIIDMANFERFSHIIPFSYWIFILLSLLQNPGIVNLNKIMHLLSKSCHIYYDLSV